MKKASSLRVGIDEAGRGPLAGPVSVCAFVIFDHTFLRSIPSNCDSKSMSVKARENLRKQIDEAKKQSKISYAVTFVHASTIDKKGIEYAITWGIQKSLQKLNLNPKQVSISLDGRLVAPKEYPYQKTYIRGDSRIKEIGLASIVAKTERDQYMDRISRKYPLYAFNLHKGYGTVVHREAIKKYGIVSLHRKTFLRNILKKRLP